MTDHWMLIAEVQHEGSHRHIDINGPAQAADVINEINEQTGRVLRYSIYRYQRDWQCDRAGCYERRIAQATAQGVPATA